MEKRGSLFDVCYILFHRWYYLASVVQSLHEFSYLGFPTDVAVLPVTIRKILFTLCLRQLTTRLLLKSPPSGEVTAGSLFKAPLFSTPVSAAISPSIIVPSLCWPLSFFRIAEQNLQYGICDEMCFFSTELTCCKSFSLFHVLCARTERIFNHKRRRSSKTQPTNSGTDSRGYFITIFLTVAELIATAKLKAVTYSSSCGYKCVATD